MKTIYLYAFLAAFVLTLLYFRAPDAFHHPRFWAEDGVWFWRQAHEDGVRSILYPLAGYLNFWPRVIAVLAQWLPTKWAPAVFLWASVALSILGAFVVRASIGGVAGFIAATAMFIAAGATEVLSTLTNVQWVLAVPLVVVALRPIDDKRAGRFAWFALPAALTGPFSMFAAPLYAVRAVLATRRLSWREAALCGGVIACALIQGAVLSTQPSLFHDQSQGGRPFWLAWRIWTLATYGWPIAALAALTIAAIVSENRRIIISLSAFAALMVAVVVVRFDHQFYLFSTGLIGQRYWFVQSAAIFAAIGATAGSKRWWLAPISIGVLLIVVHFRSTDIFKRAPHEPRRSWAIAVDQSRHGIATYEYPPGGPAWTLRFSTR